MNRPAACEGCPLHPIASGFMRPQLVQDGYGVALIGEALGEEEAKIGSPFMGKAGFRLTRLIEWAGFDRARFDIFNTVWCRPPDNKLEGQPYEGGAIAHCRQAHWDRLIARNRVLVPLGNVATGALLGKKGILGIRGYIEPGPDGTYVIPTVHPSFIQRGQSRWSAPFIADLQKAVELAHRGYPHYTTEYLLDPPPGAAYQWAKDYLNALRADPRRRLAFDIETPGKEGEEDALDVGGDLPDATWQIFRISFAYKEHHAISIPWEPAFIPAIRAVLGSAGDKVVWNAGFDVPRIKRAGVDINGTIHDGMVAWHILHSDLPKSLKFVASIMCPWQPAWKHLSHAKPAFYNAVDSDVELQCMWAIERELRRVGLWEVYDRDVIDLDPVLRHMSERGMPVDGGVRAERARLLAQALSDAKGAMDSAVPLAARKIEHVYKSEPKDRTGLLSRPGSRDIPVCPNCGLEKPRKDHFKRYVKKANPCAGLAAERRTVAVQEFYRLAEFVPSRDQLSRYHVALNRPLPMVWDGKEKKRKVSFDEEQLKKLILQYPLDKLYPAILKYRSIDKIAGTYIGRPPE